jgi:hypothetical protein
MIRTIADRLPDYHMHIASKAREHINFRGVLLLTYRHIGIGS